MQINFSIAAFDFPGKRSGLSLSCFLFFQICKRFFMTSVGPQILFKSIAKIRKSFVLILYCCHKVYKQKKRFTSCSIILSRINYFINMTLQVVFFQTVKLNSFYNYQSRPSCFITMSASPVFSFDFQEETARSVFVLSSFSLSSAFPVAYWNSAAYPFAFNNV